MTQIWFTCRSPWVVSPAMGGLIIGHEVARALHARHIFTERVDGKMTLRRGFAIKAGETAVIKIKVRADAGGYTVELPAEPRDDMAQFAAKHGPVQPGVKYEGTILIGRLEEYSIVYADIAGPLRRGKTDDQLLDAALEGMKNAVPAPVVRASKAVTVSGFPGREVELQVDGQKLLARVVVANTKLYTVVAGGPLAGGSGAERVRRFIDSFKLNAEKGAPAKKADPDDDPE